MSSPNRGKKPQVNLLNIESMPPCKDGVTTPKSCAICARFSVNPKDLCFKSVEEFMGPKVTQSAAALRQRSYEKKRQMLLAKLVPIRSGNKEKDPQAQQAGRAASTSPHRTSPHRTSPSRGESPNRGSEERRRDVDENIARAKERYSSMIANQEISGLDILLQKEMREMDVLQDRYNKMQQKRIEHYYQRRAKELAAANRRSSYNCNPETSPLRKTVNRE